MAIVALDMLSRKYIPSEMVNLFRKSFDVLIKTPKELNIISSSSSRPHTHRQNVSKYPFLKLIYLSKVNAFNGPTFAQIWKYDNK